MKAAAFDYARPASLPEALGLIAEREDAKVLAGGQSLGPLLNLRLAQPALLVDITRIAELATVGEASDGLRLGALVTHAAIEDGRVRDPTGGFLARIAAGIGYRAVRTRGTIGGSLAHADPAADWLTALTALGADLVLAGSGARRRAPLAGFVRGAMQTELGAGELIVGVHIPKFSRQARFGYHKICRKAGEFADAIGAVVHDPERGVHRFVASTPAGAPLLLESSLARVEETKMVAHLDQCLREAGFVGDAYERRLRAVVLERALNSMSSA